MVAIAIVIAIVMVGDAAIAVPVVRRSASANLARRRVVRTGLHETSRERADKCGYQKQAGGSHTRFRCNRRARDHHRREDGRTALRGNLRCASSGLSNCIDR